MSIDGTIITIHQITSNNARQYLNKMHE